MRILIVEDDKRFADHLHLSLKNRFSLIHVAYSYKEALTAINQAPYDLIIQDYCLGVSNGLEVAKYVKKQHSPPKVILMTSYGTKELAINALNVGICRFIEKPFRVKELLEMIEELYQKSSSLFRLCPESYIAYEGEDKVKLTEIEYKILSILMQNSEKLVTRNELHHFIYEDHVKSKNTLDTHITNLKRKLPSLKKNLSTLRGQGYALKNNS